MRTLLAVMQFEIRYQFRSPFFLGALLMFAMIHFLSITGIFIHLDISNQVAINSAYGILQVEQVLFIFGMLPVIAFVTTALLARPKRGFHASRDPYRDRRRAARISPPA